MTEFSLSKEALEQAKNAIHNNIYKISYNTDNKILNYYYFTVHTKKPITPSMFMSDYIEHIHHEGKIEIFKLMQNGECRAINSLECVLLRNVVGTEKYILEYIPTDIELEKYRYPNHVHAEILKIQCDSLGIDVDIELEEFNNVKKIVYTPVKYSDPIRDYTYRTKNLNFKQFTIRTKTKTDEAQFVFYFHNQIFNSVFIK